MTSKEQMAKKAARAAALATYKAIMSPPVWKVAGTSFETSPTVTDIAKAAAAASYSAVVKLAQVIQAVPVDFTNIANRIKAVSPQFFGWITAGGEGAIPGDVDAFVNYVKSPAHGKENWANPERWQELVNSISSAVGKDNTGNEKVGIKDLRTRMA